MQKSLASVKSAYNKNYELLIKSRGTPAHDKYIKIERELNRQEIRLTKPRLQGAV